MGTIEINFSPKILKSALPVCAVRDFVPIMPERSAALWYPLRLRLLKRLVL